MSEADAPLFVQWRSRRGGFAPLYLEAVMRDALGHLAPSVHPGATVLDLGSGAGHVAGALRSCGARTIALDIAPDVLAGSRAHHPGGDLVAADAARLPLASASVEAVFCFSVLQYADRSAALDEIRRVLRPDGRVALVENLEGSPIARADRFLRRVTRERYPDRLTPRHHVRWSECEQYARRFPAARIDAYDLLTPALLLLPRLYSANESEPPGSPVRKALGWSRRIDSSLLRAAPWLRHGAWTLLVRG